MRSGQSDPVISLLRELKERYPCRDIRWVIARGNRGPNYKVGNLVTAVREATYDILVMSDSDMRVGFDYLKQMVAPFLSGEVPPDAPRSGRPAPHLQPLLPVDRVLTRNGSQAPQISRIRLEE